MINNVTAHFSPKSPNSPVWGVWEALRAHGHGRGVWTVAGGCPSLKPEKHREKQKRVIVYDS